MRGTSLYALTILFVSGCSSIVHQKGFDDVKLLVQERIDKSIEWNEASELSDVATKRVASILSEELSANSAVELALLNNSGLQATFAERGLAQADLVEAGRINNPVFDGELKLRSGRAVKAELSLVEDILGILYLPLSKRIGEEAFELTKLTVAAAVIDLASDTRRAFYAHQGDLEALELRQTVAEACEASYDLAKRMQESGTATLLQRESERALFEEAKISVAAAEVQAIRSRESLATLLGLWGPQTEWNVQPRLPTAGDSPIPTDGIETQSVERSLDLAIAKRELALTSVEASGARGIRLFGDGAIGGAAEREDGDWVGGPALSLPIPLFDQGSAASYRATMLVRQREEALRDIAVRVRAAARSGYVQAESLRQQALYQKHVMVPLRRRILSETQKQYNAMLIGAFALLRAKRDEIESAVQYVTALRQYWISQTDLEQIRCGRLPAERTSVAAPKSIGSENQADH